MLADRAEDCALTDRFRFQIPKTRRSYGGRTASEQLWMFPSPIQQASSLVATAAETAMSCWLLQMPHAKSAKLAKQSLHRGTFAAVAAIA